MKKGTTRHQKTYGLARALKIDLPHAVGILEMLWEFTADNLPRGDIGSAPDADIAGAVCWTKKPKLLIDALVAEKWLDKDPTHRYIIHDWPVHAEYEVCRRLIKAKKDFLPIYGISANDRSAPGHKNRGAPAEPPRKNGASDAPSREATAKAKASENGVSGEKESEDPLRTIALWLRQYVQEFKLDWGEPDRGICRKVFNAMKGHSLDELEQCFQELYERKQKPGQNYAWFVTVVDGHFEGKQHASA